jgi:hypothetical protein
MKKLTIPLLLLLAGCQKQSMPPKTPFIVGDGVIVSVNSGTATISAVEENPMNLLVRIAKEEKLSYHIYCFANMGCNADAWPRKVDEDDSAREGRWTGHGDNPKEAVEALVNLLRMGAEPEKDHHVPAKSTYDTGVHTP